MHRSKKTPQVPTTLKDRAKDYLRRYILTNQNTPLGGISCADWGVQTGGYVADPPKWDRINPLRKLAPNEVAAWDRVHTEIFLIEDLAREIKFQEEIRKINQEYL